MSHNPPQHAVRGGPSTDHRTLRVILPDSPRRHLVKYALFEFLDRARWRYRGDDRERCLAVTVPPSTELRFIEFEEFEPAESILAGG